MLTYKDIVGKYVILLPIIVFMWTYKVYNTWKVAFLVGGAVAIAYLLFAFLRKIKIDPFMVGINCFLIGGASMFITNLGILKYMYSTFMYSTIFIWIFIVGIFYTIFSKTGFADVKKNSVVSSVSLLGATLVSVLFSWCFTKNIFVAGVAPFLALSVFRALLQEYATR